MPVDNFKLKSGREIRLRQLLIRDSLSGYLLGDPKVIRDRVIEKLPGEITETYGHTGFLIREPPAGQLPTYSCFVEFKSAPIDRDADFSSLVICWFTDVFPADVRNFIEEQLQDLDWPAWAVDGAF